MYRPEKGRPRVRILIALVFGLTIAAMALPSTGSPDTPRRVGTKQAAVANWPMRISAARLVQNGPILQLEIATAGPFSSAAMSAARGRMLCLEILRPSSGPSVRQICLRATDGKAEMVRQELRPSGSVKSTRTLTARVSRPSSRRLVAHFTPASVGLGVGLYRWRVHSQWTDSHDCSSSPCVDFKPSAAARARIVVPRLVGCRASGASYRGSGSRSSRMVAISFDDGPSNWTPSILGSLRRHHAHATFFEVGNQMGGRAALQRRILAEGNSIGDHSWSHPVLSGGGAFAASEVSSTKSRIQQQTGFTPCLFRAPYGAVSGNLIELVRQRGMLTIQWDVDPQDWARPGTGAIISRVLSQTRRGSIILMHDGGGDRSQSAAAAESILATLERRGVKVVSVETLLGLSPIYR